MINEKYCFECKKKTNSYKKGRVVMCAECGRSKDLDRAKAHEQSSRLLGWLFILGWIGFILFVILWFLK